jgi:hypothetical protein
VENLPGQRVRVSYDWSSPAQLEDWSGAGEHVELSRGSLLFKVPSRGDATLAFRAPLRPPVEVSFSVRVTTRGVGRSGVLWTTWGNLASFAGASLYAVRGGEPRLLAGRKNPQTVFAGRRRKVRLRFESSRAAGWLDGKPLYDHLLPDIDAGPNPIGIRLARGVGVDLRDLVIEGGLDAAMARKARSP